MDAPESHKYKKIYRRIFIPLSTCFVIICSVVVFWDYACFIDSKKHHNELTISVLQKLIQVRMNNIIEEANIVEARINHANSLSKITQVLGTPIFSIPKTPRVYPFISAHYFLEKEKNFSLTPYGISDLVDFPREVLKKFPKVSPRGEFYLWDDTLYYIRRIKHASSKQFDGILILFCETKEIVDSGYKHDDVNILLGAVVD